MERSILVTEHVPSVIISQKEKGVVRVACYCRVSTLHEEQELSFETQFAYYRRLVEKDPRMILVDIYGDQRSGISIAGRPEFQRMMNDCIAGKIDLILTKSISRFARNALDCVRCIRILQERGISVFFEREGINSADHDCEMLLTILASIAQGESGNASLNIRWSLEKRNERGDPARKAAYGYRFGERTNGYRKWEIFEPEAARVRCAFSMAAAGTCYAEIRCALNQLELDENTGLIWTQERLHRLLQNEVYVGDVLTNKYYVLDYLAQIEKRNHGERTQFYLEEHHEGIVKREIFQIVQDFIQCRALYSRKRRDI